MPVIPSALLAGPVRALAVTLGGLLVVVAGLLLWWPAGVAVGLALGLVVVLAMGQQQDRAARAVVQDDDLIPGLAPAGSAPAPVTAAPRSTGALPAPAAIALPARPAAQPSPVRTAAASAPAAASDAVAAPAPAAASARAAATPAPAAPGVRADLDRLKAELGDDYPDFARAARLVVSTQYASAARLQRDLQLPYSRARRLLADLESERFVGPATGSLPRQVLLPKEKLPEVERLFAGV